MDINTEYAKSIAKLNDAHRRFGRRVTVTRAAQELDINKTMEAVRSYNDFNKDNDPYGEHDFGTVFVDGTKIF